MAGFDGTAPLVLAPLVADGSQVPGQAGAWSSTSTESGLLGNVGPVRDVTAATLSVVQPSWYATVTALLVLLGAAVYGAILRRRGEMVPAVLAIPTAVRPMDGPALVAMSVRPMDITPSHARSIRP
jgi:hypothetical protein